MSSFAVFVIGPTTTATTTATTTTIQQVWNQFGFAVFTVGGKTIAKTFSTIAATTAAKAGTAKFSTAVSEIALLLLW